MFDPELDTFRTLLSNVKVSIRYTNNMVLPTTSVTRRVLLQNQYLTLAKESLVYTATLHYKEDNPLNTSLILATKSAYDEARKDIGQDYSKDGAAFILTGQGHSVFSSVVI